MFEFGESGSGLDCSDGGGELLDLGVEVCLGLAELAEFGCEGLHLLVGDLELALVQHVDLGLAELLYGQTVFIA